MTKILKQHFPVIRDRGEVLRDIYDSPDLQKVYENWDPAFQKEFINICTGVKGLKMHYDTFFKEIMNPDVVPERLEEVLSLLLQKKVRILKVLPHDSARIAAETTLLVLDIVVELEDGSIANVEVQKIGYLFPGERSACYSADLLLRQYKRIRGRLGKKFAYNDIKNVYTLVFLEKSPHEFHQFPDTYIHRSKQSFDTGLNLNLLQEYIFIALDNFNNLYHNNHIPVNNRLDAWLTFLSNDNPEKIVELITTYPDFKDLYKEVYNMCRNTEDFMRLFSKELEILDKNTVDLMIDLMQEEIDGKKGEIKNLGEVIAKQTSTIEEQTSTIEEQNSTIVALQAKIAELEKNQK